MTLKKSMSILLVDCEAVWEGTVREKRTMKLTDLCAHCTTLLGSIKFSNSNYTADIEGNVAKTQFWQTRGFEYSGKYFFSFVV